ncbi:MAG: phosphotransferase family protein [Pseudomonadota bacterium]
MGERDALLTALQPHAAAMGGTGIADLERLSGGGASQELWSFTLTGPDTPLILRRTPASREDFGLGLKLEAELMRRARAAGAPTPAVAYVFVDPAVGEAFAMEKIGGTARPRTIHTDPAFATARERAATDLGRALACIHAADIAGLPLRRETPAESVAHLAKRLAATAEARPVFELTIRRLMNTAPPPEGSPNLIHGDFRMGNLMFDETGLTAALDWELAFAGDRHADLGWVGMESWRFGQTLPMAGLTERAPLYEAYEAAGGAPIDPERVRWWELWSALHWGVITIEMGGWIRSGADRSIERHVIARRASEAELVMMAMITGRI